METKGEILKCGTYNRPSKVSVSFFPLPFPNIETEAQTQNILTLIRSQAKLMTERMTEVDDRCYQS